MAGRTWLAVVLCFFVWFGYIKWFGPPVPPPTAETETSVAANKTPAPETAQPPTRTFSDGFEAPVSDPGKSLKFQGEKANYQIALGGGRLSEVTLNDYHETVSDSSPLVKVIDDKSMPFVLSTLFSESQLRPFTEGTYEVTKQAGSKISLEKKSNGLTLRKHYELGEDGYVSKLDLEFLLSDTTRRDWGFLRIPLGGTGLEYDMKEPLKDWEAVAYQSDSLTREKLGDLEAQTLRGNTDWLAFGNRYFATALVNKSEMNPDIEFTSKDAFQGGVLIYPIKFKRDQNRLTYSFTLYTGPKDLAHLSQVEGLRELVDFGMFSVVAYPLLRVLKFFYNYVQNYGVAIILLTLLVRLLFFPLTAKSMKSMKAMQGLQPQIAALKEKYKEDRERLNREQMALFKTHKVNPAAGCLPMLIQLPVFIALYQVLANSMELFHSPFFGWIQDLSAKDPYYVYPVLMGVSMALQQKLTPSAGMEPMQQKMMMLMPIIFTFLMISLPSGLTLYIFVSTLLGILQQVFTSKNGQPAVVVSKSTT